MFRHHLHLLFGEMLGIPQEHRQEDLNYAENTHSISLGEKRINTLWKHFHRDQIGISCWHLFTLNLNSYFIWVFKCLVEFYSNLVAPKVCPPSTPISAINISWERMEMQMLGYHPETTEREALGWGPPGSSLTRPPAVSSSW